MTDYFVGRNKDDKEARDHRRMLARQAHLADQVLAELAEDEARGLVTL